MAPLITRTKGVRGQLPITRHQRRVEIDPTSRRKRTPSFRWRFVHLRPEWAVSSDAAIPMALCPHWPWTLIAIVALAWTLRLLRLDFQPLWWDEGYSVYQVVVHPATMIGNTAHDFHPPLYYLVLYAWSTVSGLGPYALRFLSACLSTLAVPLTGVLGRRCFGSHEGLLAALFVSVSPFCVHHAQEVRMYALFMLLATASTHALLKTLSAPRRGSGFLYLLASLGALYTHYAAFLLLGAQVVVVVLNRRGRARLLSWGARWSALGLMFLPWGVYALPFVNAKLVTRQRTGGLNSFDFVWRLLRVVAGGYGAQDSVFGSIATGSVLLLVVLGLALYRRKRRSGAWELLVFLAMPMGLLWLASYSLYYETFERLPRLLIYVAPLLAVLAASGVMNLARRRRTFPLAGVALILLLTCLGLGVGGGLMDYYTTIRQAEEDPRQMIARLRELSGPDDGLVADFDWQLGFLYSYMPESGPGSRYLAPVSEWVQDRPRMSSDLDIWLERHGRLWYPAYQALGGTEGRNIEVTLTQHGYLALDEWYGVTRLLLFGAAPDSLNERTFAVRFGDDILLTRAVLPDAVKPGDVLPVALEWTARRNIDERYGVFLHLEDGQGSLVAQRDAQPRVGPTDEWSIGVRQVGHHGLLLGEDIPPGEYVLYLGMTRANGDRLPISGPDGEGGRAIRMASAHGASAIGMAASGGQEASEDRVLLGTVEVSTAR